MNELKTRRDVELEYDVNEYGVITSPDKFEAEMWYAPIVWGWVLGGGQDDTRYGDNLEEGPTDYIKVTDEDRQMFDLEKDTYAFAIWTSDQVFVQVWNLTEEEYRDEVEVTFYPEDENGEGNPDY